MSYLYILEINPLSVALFENIFSQSERKAQEQGHIYMCVYIYICVCVCVCIYVYIYVYIYIYADSSCCMVETNKTLKQLYFNLKILAF